MKKSDIYDGMSRINEKYREDSCDFEKIAAEFKRAKIRRIEKYISFAACLAVAVIAGVNLHDKNIINSRSMLKPSDVEGNAHISAGFDDSVYTEPNTAPLISDENFTAGENKETNKETTYRPETSDKIQGVSSSETTIAVQTAPHIQESHKYDDNISEKPTNAVTVPDASEKPAVTLSVTTKRPVVTTSVTTKKPDKITEKPVVTIPDKTEKPVVTEPDKTGEPDEGTNGGPPLHWDEMNTTQQYFMCTFENKYYKSINKTIDSVFVGEYLGIAETDGYDFYNDEYYHRKAKAYEINGVPKTDSVAVLFDNETEFFTYINCG